MNFNPNVPYICCVECVCCCMNEETGDMYCKITGKAVSEDTRACNNVEFF